MTRYWRNKRGAEVDFVLLRRGAGPVAVECKWSAASFDPASAFRRVHPDGDNFVVAHDVDVAHTRGQGGLDVRFVSLDELIAELSSQPLRPS